MMYNYIDFTPMKARVTMTDLRYDVLAVGNAIVDILSHETDEFLQDNNLVKGSMALIDEVQSQSLYDKMGVTVEQSGGSAGNTIAGIASFGGQCAYIGKVANDQFGKVFRHDMTAIGVDYATDFAIGDTPTAQCLIAVTPDGQRTMSTYLGVSTDLSEADLDEDKIKAAQVVYLEGYLFDKPKAKQAFQKAAQYAHDAGNKVSLTLSDGFCVERHRSEFRELVANHVDILFANEQELKALYETDHFEEAITMVENDCPIVAVTRGENGSVILWDGQEYSVDAYPVQKVIDTTGAGDLYAAGFLYGYTQGYNAQECGRLGSIAAAEIISHMGARPEKQLSDLAA